QLPESGSRAPAADTTVMRWVNYRSDQVDSPRMADEPIAIHPVVEPGARSAAPLRVETESAPITKPAAAAKPGIVVPPRYAPNPRPGFMHWENATLSGPTL